MPAAMVTSAQKGSPAVTRTVVADSSGTACDLLAAAMGLPKARVKDCMTKGGVWWKRPGRAMLRLRRATTAVQAGDTLEINYDPHLLALNPPLPELVGRTARFSVWNKPPGVLAQGTRFADHCAMPRLTQALLQLRSEPHPVHRLDREAMGLMLLAHDTAAAASLARLLAAGSITKTYEVITRGIPTWTVMETQQSLDGKPCCSRFELLAVNASSDTAHLSAHIGTGRRHQIRRHLALLGYPVLGDTQYGRAHPAGLQLLARTLGLVCPFTQRLEHYSLPNLIFPLPIAETPCDLSRL